MDSVKNMIAVLSERLKVVAAANAVVARPVSVGDRHVVPLCEIGLSFGGGGGSGEGEVKGSAGGGYGAGAGGGAKASPVALLVVDGNDVRLEKVGR